MSDSAISSEPIVQELRVIVTDVEMPFSAMVILLIKWTLAAIPALLVLGALWVGLLGLMSITRMVWR